jgi:hypothetical protein
MAHAVHAPDALNQARLSRETPHENWLTLSLRMYSVSLFFAISILDHSDNMRFDIPFNY